MRVHPLTVRQSQALHHIHAYKRCVHKMWLNPLSVSAASACCLVGRLTDLPQRLRPSLRQRQHPPRRLLSVQVQTEWSAFVLHGSSAHLISFVRPFPLSYFRTFTGLNGTSADGPMCVDHIVDELRATSYDFSPVFGGALLSR